MSFFSKKTHQQDTNQKAPSNYKERNQIYLAALNFLLIYLKEFSFNIKKPDSGAFKNKIDEMQKLFSSSESTDELNRFIDKNKDYFFEHILGEKEFITKKESEFKNIIELLLSNIASTNNDNSKFNNFMLEKSSALEKINELDDIKEIKKSLTSELGEIKRSITEKKERDESKVREVCKKAGKFADDLNKFRDAYVMDELTGVYRRTAFDLYLKNLVERSAITKTDFSLLIMEVDKIDTIRMNNLNIFNRVLVALVDQISLKMDKSDYLARLDETKFAVILIESSLRQAIKTASKMSKEISKQTYWYGENSNKQEISFTVSAGVSAFDSKKEAQSIVNLSLQALEYAKKSGGNRVVSEKDIQ